MKNTLIKIALTNVLLTAVLVSLSCTDVPQNKTVVNSPANNSVAQKNTNQNDAGILTQDCSGDPPVRQKKIKDGIKASIDKENDLKYQLKKRFDFEPIVDSTSGDAVLYIWGNVYTDAKGLNKLNNTYEGYVKKGCVTKVVFDKAPTVETLNSGFQFDLCESPNQVCSNGTCQETCSKEIDDKNTNADSNANKANKD